MKRYILFLVAGLLSLFVIQGQGMAADFYTSDCGPGGVICSNRVAKASGGNENNHNGGSKDTCSTIKNNIRDGMSAKDVTKSFIELGHDACLVIRCAIEANGNLEQIMIGALEAGTTSDVCSRCAMMAGADPKLLATILEGGLGYSPVPGGGLTQIDTNLPGGQKGGGLVSSHRFR